MDGLLLIDKPEGMTSAEVVRVVKRHVRCKTGHLGTLDPFASGVLPLCLGAGTKIAQFLNAADKQYTGIMRLGSATDTGDLTGRVVATAPVPALLPEALVRTAARFCGELLQTPPMYSAIKRQGTPLYRLARQGLTVERQARCIRIHALELKDRGDGAVGFAVSCSKGTYIRVLAEDVAAALGSVGHLEQLRRTRFGRFRVEDAIGLDGLDCETFPVIGLREALCHLREISVDAATARRARHGYEPILDCIPPGGCDEAAKLVGPDGRLASVIVMDGRSSWRFARVFADSGHATP